MTGSEANDFERWEHGDVRDAVVMIRPVANDVCCRSARVERGKLAREWTARDAAAAIGGDLSLCCLA